MSRLFRALVQFDRGLRTVFAPMHSVRPTPGEALAEGELSPAQKRHAAALMRVNHVGEVCAQALYNGQAFASANAELRAALAKAGQQETEHLAWCETRIDALGGRKSRLNPLWYAGAFAIGVAASRAGDGWNLGFLAETERQVESHLGGHLQRLPANDAKSRAVVKQMQDDEIAHADLAVQLGARPLPLPLRLAMRLAAKVMTTTAYRC